MERSRSLVIAVGVVAGLAVGGVAAAQSNNYSPYPLGPRATGLGGAYTALGDDPAGAWYNPAAPAFTADETMSLSTSLYGFIGGHDRDALGKGEHYEYRNYNVIPSSVSTFVRLGKDGKSRWAFNFNIFSPANGEIDARTVINDGAVTLFRATNDALLLMGPGFTFKVNDRFAVGGAVWGIYHTLHKEYDLTDITPSTLGDGTHDILQLTQSEEQMNFGFTAAFGLRWEPVKNFLVGLSVRIPSFMIWGEGESFTRFVIAVPSFAVGPYATSSTDATKTKIILPARFNLGLAYRNQGKFAIGVDVSVYLPQTYNAVFSASNPDLIQVVRQNVVVNAAVGMEVFMRPSWPLRLGFFTDFSAAPIPTLDPESGDADHINLFGGTVTVGKVGADGTETMFGVTAAVGPTKVVGYDFAQGTYERFISDGYQYRVFLVYCGAFSI